jgi:hypothetical protein
MLNPGCAAVGVTLLGVGIGTAAGQGISYSLDSVAYKTFTAPIEGLETAILRSLERMDIPVKGIEDIESGRKIMAEAGDRDVEIELDRITSRTSRMRVNVSQAWFLRDRATATEIIIQTAQTLDDEPRLTQPARPRPAGVQPARVQPAAR